MSKRVKKSKVATPLQAEGTDVSALSNVARPKIIRGRRGGLKDMLNMPTDILLEIFRHFHPRDLLSLARTTKEFRAFLMSRNSSLNIWKASRQHIEGLPDCPEHLSEPAYANLVFFPHCHNCLRGNVKAVLWHLNARYCKDCRSKLLCSQYQAAISIPSSMFRAGFMLLNLNHVGFLLVAPRYDQYYFMTERIKELCDQWTELPDDDVVRTTFIETLRTKENQICDHADLCIAWENKRLDSRAEELMSVRKTRLEALESPTAWVKIRQDLIAYMQGIKEERLTVERFEILSERCRKFASMVLDVYATPRRTAETEYLPLPGDLAMMSSIRDVLEAPNDVDVSTEIIESLSDLLPALTQAWKADIRSRCTQILQEHLPDGDVACLDLAIAFLECVGCHRILRYPAILSHKCLRKVYNHYPSEDNMVPQYEQAVFSSNGHRRPLSTEILRVSSAIDNCQKILRALGKDPMVTTEGELDEQNARLCFTKPNRPLVKQLMAWRVAVSVQIPGLDTCCNVRRRCSNSGHSEDFRNKGNGKWQVTRRQKTRKLLRRQQPRIWRQSATFSGVAPDATFGSGMNGAFPRLKRIC
ncbi:hypothetical protein WOLCODRAFT_66907 [Wolfiporia cocos MD-104 SS10]|uniref:F-box domain-containing protein n=1 Tax=Wolfiporia cocos (strain MD-104) TaxID=742152 RepID=A0A2H3JET6_WOLCO|nr:hypothetical protein WOLCODRAFT_66907 [Wolfiporia cocos MD-104 SS10]